MTRTRTILFLAALGALAAEGKATSHPGPGAGATVAANELHWVPGPPDLPAGVQMAVLAGDPAAAGPVTLRLWFPPGSRVMPHRHARAENLTVLSGDVHIGWSDKIDRAKAHALGPGGFSSLPPDTVHYLYTDHGAMVQLEGEGPIEMTYVHPTATHGMRTP